MSYERSTRTAQAAVSPRTFSQRRSSVNGRRRKQCNQQHGAQRKAPAEKRLRTHRFGVEGDVGAQELLGVEDVHAKERQQALYVPRARARLLMR